MPPDYGAALRAPNMQGMTPGINPAAPPVQGGQAPAMANRPNPEQVKAALDQQPQNVRERLAEQMAGRSPEQQEEFLTNWFADWTAKAGAAQGDMDRADALRMDLPEGQTTRNGIYTAANPLEHIMAGVNNYQRGQEYSTARDARSEALEGGEAARKQYADLY